MWRLISPTACQRTWLAQNLALFECKFKPLTIIFVLIEARLLDYRNDTLLPRLRAIEPLSSNKDTPWSFFDGASQENSRKCGNRFLLFISYSVYFVVRANIGVISNNCGELMTLFYLMKWARNKNVIALNIVGDSSLVIHFIKRMGINKLHIFSPSHQL